jgi:hypothetical protein
VTVFPDSIVLTNKRIIICKPKNLGFSMDFVDYNWDGISHTFVNESILGSEFSFTTKTNLTISIDYLPKIQARKIYTFAKEQLEQLKSNTADSTVMSLESEIIEEKAFGREIPEVIEEIETEEVTNFSEIIPVAQSGYRDEKQFPDANPASKEHLLGELSQDELFDKLQNYKRLLDNGLIMQGEYDSLKKEILSYM